MTKFRQTASLPSGTKVFRRIAYFRNAFVEHQYEDRRGHDPDQGFSYDESGIQLKGALCLVPALSDPGHLVNQFQLASLLNKIRHMAV